jgi:DNA-binding HxlR family transcriptional regulator
MRYEKCSMKQAAVPRRVRGSKTGRPIMTLLDLLGRRMALRVLWELSQAQAPTTFRELQGAADTNPSVLNSRLKELREAGLVDHVEKGYCLTVLGESLLKSFLPLYSWAEGWAKRGGL